MGNSSSLFSKVSTDGACCAPLTEGEIFECFQNVYNRMRNDDAVDAMTLPPIEAFPNLLQCCRNIEIKFFKTPISRSLSNTKTISNSVTGHSKIEIYYYGFETRERPQIIKARLIHEGTHALRFQIVLMCSAIGVPGTYEFATPQKQHFHFQGRMFLDDRMHSGYWMEHALIGGVWLVLNSDGQVLDINTNTVSPIADPKGTLFFAIQMVPQNFTKFSVNGASVNFHCIVGNRTGDVSGIHDEHIYFNGSLTTRNGGGCARTL